MLPPKLYGTLGIDGNSERMELNGDSLLTTLVALC